MIKINLLPQEITGGRGGGKGAARAAGGGGGSALVALVFVLLFGLDAALATYMYYSYEQAKQAYTKVKTEADKVKEELKTTEIAYNTAKANFEVLERLVRLAEALDPPDRFLWARKLNMLPSVVPDGVHLTEFTVSEKIVEKETAASLEAKNKWNAGGKKGPQPTTQRVPTFTQTLDIAGVAFVADGTPGQRLDQIIRFESNIRDLTVTLPFNNEQSQFIDGFARRVEFSGPVTAGKISGRDVSRFTFRLISEPFKIEG